jgi:hypothetical protein
VEDDRARSSSLKPADELPAAARHYDRGVLLVLRACYLAIVVPLFIVALCFVLPAWCWRMSRSHTKRGSLQGEHGRFSKHV